MASARKGQISFVWALENVAAGKSWEKKHRLSNIVQNWLINTGSSHAWPNTTPFTASTTSKHNGSVAFVTGLKKGNGNAPAFSKLD